MNKEKKNSSNYISTGAIPLHPESTEVEISNLLKSWVEENTCSRAILVELFVS